MAEVRARGGELYVFADGDSAIESADGMHVIRLPENYGDLSPVLHVVPLQLLAYHTALVRGTDVDKPRNLAKSVTVEYADSDPRNGKSLRAAAEAFSMWGRKNQLPAMKVRMPEPTNCTPMQMRRKPMSLPSTSVPEGPRRFVITSE